MHTLGLLPTQWIPVTTRIITCPINLHLSLLLGVKGGGNWELSSLLGSLTEQ